ncbi:hypothetical protein NCS55_01281600 [Fusarium keratoplasticum]|nr:hypothetical protein NCS55_01281600 [Fusarium keratoplasticum]
MYAPAPPRNKKTDITRSRSGCARCRQKRRKCDEGKPSCRRCVSAMADCEYGAITLKFREATRWAAQKVELGKAMSSAMTTKTTPSPPHTLTEMVQEHRASISDESRVSPVYQQVSPPRDIEAFYRDAPPASFLADQNDCNQSSVGVPELGAEADPSPVSIAAVDPPTVSEGSMSGSLLHSFYSPKWSGVPLGQLGFDLASTTPGADDALYPNLLDFHDSLVDTGLEEPYWNDIMMHNPVGDSPASPLQQQSTDADLPWPKAQKPPPGSKISVGHRIYLAHFKVAVLQAFPLELPFLWDMVIKSEPVRYAALSLSAANLANLQGQQPDDNESAWVAMPAHSARASDFSKQTVEALESGTAASLDARLVTMILVVFYELEASSFSSAFHSLSILNVMILSCPEDVLRSTNGRIIIQWWLHLRTFIAHAQGPYSLYGPEDPTESLINQLEVRVAGAPQMIDLITTKATRIWHRVLVAKCFEAPGDRPVNTMRKVDDWWRILKGNHLCEPARDDQSRILGEDELCEELDKLQRTLDACDAPSGFQSSMLEEAKGVFVLWWNAQKTCHASSQTRLWL